MPNLVAEYERAERIYYGFDLRQFLNLKPLTTFLIVFTVTHTGMG